MKASKTSRHIKTLVYIIGPDKTFELRKGHLVGFGGLIGCLVLSAVGVFSYFYGMQWIELRDLQAAYDSQKQQLIALQKKEDSVAKKLPVTKPKLAALTPPSSQASKPQTVASKKQETPKVPVIPKKPVIAKKPKVEKKPIVAITQKSASQKKEPPQKKEVVITPKPASEKPPLVEVAVEGVVYQVEKNRLSIQFNLRNITSTAQSGYVSIVGVSKNNANKPIQFGTYRSSKFHIKRFRQFSKEFNLKKQNLASVNVVVWNDSQKKLLEKRYPVVEAKPVVPSEEEEGVTQAPAAESPQSTAQTTP